jgi:DNA polymerase-3 subunit delta
VKIAPRDADRFVRRPPEGLRVAVVYGPDRGLVRERSEALARAVVPDAADPFRIAELAGDRVARDPALLADEAAAIAFGGGRRVVHVRDADDGVAVAAGLVLERLAADALVIVEAGELAARSALRALVEKAAAGAAIACYHDEGATLARTIDEALAAHGLGADREARTELALALGGDRLASRAEIAKLAAFMGERTAVTRSDVEAAVGDAAEASLDEVAFAVGAGDAIRLERALGRAFAQGENEVAVLRAVLRHVALLHGVAIRAAASGSREDALGAVRPPLHFRVRDAAVAALPRWTAARLERALTVLMDAEIAVKTTGNPQRVIVRKALLDLALLAART